MSDDNISDGKHVAAAILAVEAARQTLALNPQMTQTGPFNASAYLFDHYREMLRQLDQTTR
ncbi:MAG TPA: hypothetical protein VGF33_07360 [Caulobacteraceae bacterium]|jgi:hypothetical protein